MQKEPFDQSGAGGKDSFGVQWTFDPAINGSTPTPGTRLVKDLEHWENDVTFPNLDELDWAGCAKANRDWLSCGSYSAFTVFTGLFERLWSFIDMTEAFLALMDEELQPAVHRLFDRLCVYYDGIFERVHRWFDCDTVWFHDDWGGERSAFFSIDTCREMLLPYLKRIVDSVHRHGMYFEFHSCGKNETLVPVMIEAGVDMWAGYGQQIKLGVEPRPIPPDAPEQAVRDEIHRLLDTFPDGNIFMARHRGMHPLEYPIFYEETRKICAM